MYDAAGKNVCFEQEAEVRDPRLHRCVLNHMEQIT